MQLLEHRRHALLVIAMVLLLVDVLLVGPGVWLAASLLRPSVLHSDGLSAAFLLLRNALLYAAEGSFAALVLFSWRRIPWREIGMRLPSDPARAFVLLLFSLSAIVAILLVDALWSFLFWRVFHTLPDRDVQWTLYSGPASHAAQVVLLLLGAPLCEEIIFRGLMQGWAMRMGVAPWMAIGGTALLFAAGHLDPSNLESYFLSGLILGYLAYRTRSLLPGMIWHALFNFLALLGLLLH